MNVTAITPASAAPGETVILAGVDISLNATINWRGLGKFLTSFPVAISATEVRAVVPSFDGAAGAVAVWLAIDEGESNPLSLAVEGVPAVAPVYPLCSLAALKRALGVTSGETLDDDKLTALIEAASATITGECGVDFRPALVEGELADGDGTAMLALRRRPIASVQALRILGVAVDVHEVRVYGDYIAFDEDEGEYSARIRAASRVFPKGRQNIEVDYTAGYTLVPGEISFACLQQAVHILNTLAKSGVTSENNSVSGASAQYAQVGIAPSIRGTVARYRGHKLSVI
jgi:hypothetical protein